MGGYYPVQIEDSTDARKIINIISVEAGVSTAPSFVNVTKKKNSVSYRNPLSHKHDSNEFTKQRIREQVNI